MTKMAKHSNYTNQVLFQYFKDFEFVCFLIFELTNSAVEVFSKLKLSSTTYGLLPSRLSSLRLFSILGGNMLQHTTNICVIAAPSYGDKQTCSLPKSIK